MHSPAANTTPTTTGRRGFLARLSAAAAAFAATGTAAAASAHAAVAPPPPFGDDALEPWLRDLRGRKHRQLFHAHDKMDGSVLWQARLFYDLYEKNYGVTPKQLGVVIAAHGPTGGMLFNDTLWSKYELGKMYKVTMRDPNAPATPAAAPVPDTSAVKAAAPAAPATGTGTGTGTAAPTDAKPAASTTAAAPQRPPRIPATRNVFSSPRAGDPVDETRSVETLMKLGTTFLICGNALNQFANYTAKKNGTTQEVALEELRANLLPGTIVVPTMLIGINRAQEQGCSYLYSG